MTEPVLAAPLDPGSHRTAVTGQPTESVASRGWTVPAVIGLLATALAVIGSWHVSLWTDEAATITSARRTLPQLWRMLHTIDAVHGLYDAGMHAWVSVVGSSPFALRLPSALAAGVAAAGVVVLARRLAGPGVGVAAGLVFAALPRATWMGIEGRSYAFTATGAVWLTVLLLAAVRRPVPDRALDSQPVDGRPADRRPRTAAAPWWLGYAVLAAVSVALNVYLALLLAAHALTLLLDRSVTWRQRWTWLGAAVAGVLVASPVVLEAAGQTGQLGDTPLGPAQVLRQVVVNQGFLGDTPTPGSSGSQSLSGLSTGSLWAPAAVALAAVSWVMVALLLLRRRTVGPGPVGDLARWLVPWLAVPTAVVAGYSLVVSPMYSPRYLTFTAPAVAVLLGAAVVRVVAGRSRVVVAVVLLALAAPVYVSQRGAYAKSGTDWVSVARVVFAHGAGEAVYFTPRRPPTGPTTTLTLRYVAVAYPAAFSGLRDVTLRTTGSADGSLTGTSTTLASSTARLAGAPVVWVLRRDDYPAAAAAADDAVLARAGFSGGQVFRGPSTTVLRLIRR